ncbi:MULTISPECIES: alpha/beta hydrolase family protein [Olivibacter]|jgi:dienelactone hydrolase|uniref:Alpha/beta hydrolase family protein n=2 Tax=Olivibacter TaxID=376469 RepID=A0ABV6HHX6_9SPHI|nr:MULTISPECIES: alpha/beta fold hydrolase [Olivibacter]MCL4640997.1 alpha/beta fold hydrolase [Olivibacter sp. UJ_SKK_5.1]MDX3913669.1 alpha/beta fold hydrolase [Pseudosphingobacterium sp.]QEL01380.1 alpha/beta fold hydrolase [Olivibacter sp. LS-1]
MAKVKNIMIRGSNNRPIVLDIFFNESRPYQPAIIYAHGFNGFKDWGNFDLIAEQFLASGFTFIKFNFSHNGTSPDQPENFVDLTAFSENNYTKQLHDLEQVIDWVQNNCNPYGRCIDKKSIGLIGHSMGGGISVIKAAEDARIKALVTWSAIAFCKTPWGDWPKEKISDWKQTGVAYYVNGRTRQKMPLNYQLYEDYLNNGTRLDIIKAASSINIPWMICHGTEDINVPLNHAYNLKEANGRAVMVTVSSDHVFGRKHPWYETIQPTPMQDVLNRNILFFKQHLDK